MTSEMQRKIGEEIARVSAQMAAVNRVIDEVTASGTASATISAGGGSKSYTRLDLPTLTQELYRLERRLSALRYRLAGTTASPVRRIYFTR